VPATLADPTRVDHIEVVDIASGEVLLFWDLAPLPAARLARSLRADLAQVEPGEFAERWLRDADAAAAAPSSDRSTGSGSWV
jgi:hypothetical protein